MRNVTQPLMLPESFEHTGYMEKTGRGSNDTLGESYLLGVTCLGKGLLWDELSNPIIIFYSATSQCAEASSRGARKPNCIRNKFKSWISGWTIGIQFTVDSRGKTTSYESRSKTFHGLRAATETAN